MKLDFERNVLDNPNLYSQRLPPAFLTLLGFNWKLRGVLALLDVEIEFDVDALAGKAPPLKGSGGDRAA